MLDPLSLEDSKPKAITLKLPSHLVSVIDRLKGEYGVRRVVESSKFFSRIYWAVLIERP